MSDIRRRENHGHSVEPALAGETCVALTGQWARTVCGDKAHSILDGKPSCLRHLPLAVRPVLEVSYIMGVSEKRDGDTKRYPPAVNEVYILSRKTKLVNVLPSNMTGYRSQISIDVFERDFAETPRKAVEMAIKKAGQESDRLRGLMVKAQEHEAEMISMLAAMPDDATEVRDE